MDIEYRWLQGSDLDQLEPILASSSWPSLNPNTSRAIAAYDGDKLVGFCVLQLFPHCEPLYVDPAYRGNGLATSLFDKLYAFMAEIQIRSFMSIATSSFSEKLCTDHGMKKIDSPVYIL